MIIFQKIVSFYFFKILFFHFPHPLICTYIYICDNYHFFLLIKLKKLFDLKRKNFKKKKKIKTFACFVK